MYWEHTEYGDTWADLYDGIFADADDTEPSVDALARLAQNGTVLELGAGTGRLAIPLAQRGIGVHIVEISSKMLDILERKAAAASASIAIHQADMCDFDLGCDFEVAFISRNTLSILATQEEQLMCMKSAARHVRPGGVLIIDQGIPGLDALTGDGTLRYTHADSDGVWVIGRRHDWIAQQVISQRMHLRATGFFNGTMKGRYVWPSEMDLMAQIAGLRLCARWSDWNGHDFVAGSRTFISHYRAEPKLSSRS